MIHLDSIASVKLALVLSALMAAAAANASLLDCTKSRGTESDSGVNCVANQAVADNGQESTQDAHPTTPINTAPTGFQIDQTRTGSAVPESAPLLILFGALLAVVLVRAKSHNSK